MATLRTKIMFLLAAMFFYGLLVIMMLKPLPPLGLENQQCVSKCQQYLVDSIPSTKTLCGFHAESRGEKQKIISFSFYGDLKSKYYDGVASNLDYLDEYYPGWIMRLYLDPTNLNLNASHDLCALSCKSNRMDLCSVLSVPPYGNISSKFGMIWRFLPLADPFVDFMVSRDLDSRFSARETAAVNDWLSLGLPFHIMRDHPHHRRSILGGMWGARMDLDNRERYKNLFETLFEKTSDRWQKGYDQSLLHKFVWPAVQNEACIHDSYTCNLFPAPHNRPWPTQRKNGTSNFVAASFRNQRLQPSQHCPELCRPKDHLEWKTC
ncbi:uncharacterized protein LOC111716729 isoform X2 [Eurytemora carolleeae]|nr:uncharacterized protein LOC111716729 isoform X2 [Eurytemora carolleeae]XP_023347973.1 uncharacterized protein LOC111716729 isoform X2 [Eurytemora carolleeae]XP_023347974.1 uncharacterized protein LOC111716729 isoform X2 [Eurytemora carolleeae]|eukprot:XP_023347972.1 uncharacterized protein LOC111716729 isoform X2 [Eurytemora affinis]